MFFLCRTQLSLISDYVFVRGVSCIENFRWFIVLKVIESHNLRIITSVYRSRRCLIFRFSCSLRTIWRFLSLNPLLINCILPALGYWLDLAIYKSFCCGHLIVGESIKWSFSDFRLLHNWFLWEKMHHKVYVNANVFIIFHRLTYFEVEFIKRNHLQVLDLHDYFNFTPKFKFWNAIVVKVSFGVFQYKLVFLKTYEHIGDFVTIHTGGISLGKSFLTLLGKYAFNLVVIIAYVEIVISFCDVGAERSLMLLM